jgi:hypothetical protein
MKMLISKEVLVLTILLSSQKVKRVTNPDQVHPNDNDEDDRGGPEDQDSDDSKNTKSDMRN